MDDRKIETALEECHKQLGDNVTVLDNIGSGELIEKWMKAAGSHWDCYFAENFFGWDADQVVVVTG